MTLDEAIIHAEEVAEEQEKAAKGYHENQVRKCELFPFAEMDYTYENVCKECAAEHRQLVEWLKELKQLREQEPCEDAISRQAALKLFFVDDTEYTGSEICNMIHGLPSVHAEPTCWIPVSERLPEAGEEYLCCDANGFMEVGYLSKSLGEWCTNGEVYEGVIAWMPLPKPYEPQESEEV